MPSALATSAIGRPASTRSRTLRRNSGGYPRLATPLSSWVEWHGIQQHDSTEPGEDHPGSGQPGACPGGIVPGDDWRCADSLGGGPTAARADSRLDALL